MKMLFITTAIFLIVHPFQKSLAQEKTRDLGLVTSSVNLTNLPLSFVYKSGKENKFWRYQIGNIEIVQSYPKHRLDTLNINEELSSTYNAAFEIAREKRKQINTKFSLYHGVSSGLSASYWQYSYEEMDNNGPAGPKFHNKALGDKLTIQPFVGYSIGAIFNLTDQLYFSAQLNPKLYHQIEYYSRKDADLLNKKTTRDEAVLSQKSGISINQNFVTVGLFYSI